MMNTKSENEGRAKVKSHDVSKRNLCFWPPRAMVAPRGQRPTGQTGMATGTTTVLRQLRLLERLIAEVAEGMGWPTVHVQRAVRFVSYNKYRLEVLNKQAALEMEW